ncbi:MULTISPECIES: hypothetical protein [unclassified Streptomyces]|uniref:hypothetical protein n=1 Tax=unclassified Streptomyces TaxID=2593676 RepID=UPI00364CEDFA
MTLCDHSPRSVPEPAEQRHSHLKEKFGGLRVYVDRPASSGDALRTLIASAETEAERTCEFCGAPGRIRTRDDRPGGWRKAVCGACHSAWSARRIMIVCGEVHTRE